jgi:hypothetical protein
MDRGDQNKQANAQKQTFADKHLIADPRASVIPPALGRTKVRRDRDKDAKRIRQLRDEGQS